jgi:hypothetical protein
VGGGRGRPPSSVSSAVAPVIVTLCVLSAVGVGIFYFAKRYILDMLYNFTRNEIYGTWTTQYSSKLHDFPFYSLIKSLKKPKR